MTKDAGRGEAEARDRAEDRAHDFGRSLDASGDEIASLKERLAQCQETLSDALGVIDCTRDVVGGASRQSPRSEWAEVHAGRAKSSLRQMNLLSGEIRECLNLLDGAGHG